MAAAGAFTARDHPEDRAKRLNALRAHILALDERVAAALPDSTAATLADLKADHNALLQALRDAGLQLNP